MQLPLPFKKAVVMVEAILKQNGYILESKRDFLGGIQFKLRKGNEDIGHIRFYQKKRNDSTTVDLSQIKNKTELLKIESLLKERFSKDEGKTKLPLNYPFRLPLHEPEINKIKKILTEKFGAKSFQPHPPKIGFLRVDGIAISIYKNGAILLQGKPTKLADSIVNEIEKIYEEASRRELLFILRENLLGYHSDTDYEKIKEEVREYELELTEYISERLFKFLNTNDRMEIRDGLILLKIVKREKLKLKNYATLVRNFAIAYEGFLLKLFWELGLIKEFDLGRPVKIGNILKPGDKGLSVLERKFQPYFVNKTYLPKKMWSYWQECRNDYLHSDPIKMTRLDRLENAESKIRELINIMEECLEVLYPTLHAATIEDENVLNIPLIGIDEAGKGDYFGPLVTVALYVDKESLSQIHSIVKSDSKKLSDSRIVELAEKIKKIAKVKVVKTNPEKYNELYEKIKNLNVLLAWQHSRALENMLREVNCEYALSDQFGDESLIKNKLMQLGKRIKLIQRPKADEINPIVAAASIVAKAEFLRELDYIRRKYKMSFPKGASSEVIRIGRKFVKKYGKEKLREVAKLHFRTTNEIFGNPS